MSIERSTVGLDQPLRPGSALGLDKLSRRGFADAAVSTLGSVSSTAGFVLSIEGAWGSGKTSALAMIEEILHEIHGDKRPVVVHFNPWLVGDRDALLRQFLTKLASAIELADHAKDGKKVAKEIKAYAKAFDVLKLIPGAEPWASLVKSVFEKIGDASESIAEHKGQDIERRKSAVESALKEYPRPIVVFVDDIDRLFPLEVFEMVRIIKAVGNLPHVGYVLAWDPSYVVGALKQAAIPQAEGYLDKIVQVRMPLPSLSLTARGTLINEALAALHPDASKPHFGNVEHRLSELYFSGLREVLAQPRDVTRVFNAVATIEPGLRAEVVLSDIVGLAALMVKAPPVFELLKQSPKFFVGRMPQDGAHFEKSKDILKSGSAARDQALADCAMPDAVRRMVHHLFPRVADCDGEMASNRVRDIDGHIAHPARLMIALQMSISPSDISLAAARRFVARPEQRGDIAKTLTVENCLEFLEAMGDLVGTLGSDAVRDLEALCLSIARMADVEPFPSRSKRRDGAFAQRSEDFAIRAIGEMVKAVDATRGTALTTAIVSAEDTICVATELLVSNYSAERSGREPLICEESRRDELLAMHADNVLRAAKSGQLLRTCHPGYTLWHLARLWPTRCNAIFSAIKERDPSLDSFVLEFLSHSFDSDKGQTYMLPREREVLEAYCSVEDLRAQAESRLADAQVTYPLRAAWRSVVEGKKLYAVDGTEARW